MIVGASGSRAANGHGSVYVYQFDGTAWEQQQVIEANDSAYNFGAAIALSGDLAVVSAPAIPADDNVQRGAIYFLCSPERCLGATTEGPR